MLLLGAALLTALLLSGCQTELPDDGPPPATSQAAALRFVKKVVAAGEKAAETGRFSITISQEEVTSFLTVGATMVAKLQTLPIEDLEQIQDIPGVEGIEGIEEWKRLVDQAERLENVRLPGNKKLQLNIEEPGVYFRGNGQLLVRGYVRLLVLRQPVRVVVAPRASGGELVLDFVEGQLGPVPMPEILFDYVGEGLAGAILAGQEYAEITEIRVGEGTLTFSGRRNQQ
jgi:hypothetical protein